MYSCQKEIPTLAEKKNWEISSYVLLFFLPLIVTTRSSIRRTRPWQYRILFVVSCFLFTMVVIVYEWLSSSKEALKGFHSERRGHGKRDNEFSVDCLSGVSVTDDLLAASFEICRFKRFFRINFRVTSCLLDQYFVFYAIRGPHFWSLSQYSYQFLLEVVW